MSLDPAAASPSGVGVGVPAHLASNIAYTSQHAQLQTVAAMHTHNEQLKGELSKSIKLGQELQQQNVMLQTAYGKMKSENEEMREAYIRIRAQAESALAAKTSAENECEKLYQQWQEKLQQKQSEFEVIQASMVPTRELDLIRLQILQEANASHALVTNELKNDLTKFRNLYHETHHQLMLVTNDMNLKIQTYEKDLLDIRTRSERNLNEFTLKNRKLQELIQDTTLSEKVKSLERLNSEMLLKQKSLQLELEECIKYSQTQTIVAEQSKMGLAVSQAERDACMKQAEHASELSEKMLIDLRKDLSISQAQVHSLREESLNISKLHEHGLSKLEGSLEDAIFCKTDLERRLKDQERKECEVVKRLNESIEEMNERNSVLEGKFEDVRRNMEFQQREHAGSIKSLKEEHSCNVRDLEHQILLLQESKTSLQTNMLELELRKNEEISQYKSKILTLQSELSVLQTERDTFDQRLDEMKLEHEQLRTECNEKLREYTDLSIEYEQLQGRHRSSNEKLHVLEGEYDRQSLECESIRSELLQTTKGLDEERKSFMLEMTQLKTSMRQEKDLLTEKLSSSIKQMKQHEERWLKELNEMRKEKTKYKKVALNLKQKMGEILRYGKKNSRQKRQRVRECVRERK